MTVFRNLERAYITSQTATHTLKRVYLLKVGAWCLSSSFRLSHWSLITNTKLMLQVQVATKLGHAWCLSSSFWLSHNYLSTNTTLMLQVGILMQSTVSRKKPDVGPKHLNQKNTCLTTARPTQSKTPVCQFRNVFRACISRTYFWKFAPLVLTARRNALLWGHFPWVDISPELICLWSKTRNLHRKMTGFFKICAGKSFLKFNRLRKNRNLFGRNMMHITLISRWSLGFFGCDLGKLRIDTSHQHSMIWHQVLEWVRCLLTEILARSGAPMPYKTRHRLNWNDKIFQSLKLCCKGSFWQNNMTNPSKGHNQHFIQNNNTIKHRTTKGSILKIRHIWGWILENRHMGVVVPQFVAIGPLT